MDFIAKMDQLFKIGEHAIYFIIGILLILSALFLVYDAVVMFFHYPDFVDHIKWAVELLAKTLLMLMIIEILYTVRVSMKSHALRAEPFLIVALIAAIRRILVISVETAYFPAKFNHHMIEVSILGGLILIFTVSILFMNRFTTTQFEQ